MPKPSCNKNTNITHAQRLMCHVPEVLESREDAIPIRQGDGIDELLLVHHFV